MLQSVFLKSFPYRKPIAPICKVYSVTEKEYFGSASGDIGNWRLQAAQRNALYSRYSLWLSVIIAAALLGIGAWQRRWIADDALIVLRTVRNLLAGNGPVFNVGERVEVNTSTTWTYLIWLIAYVTGFRLEYIALITALICGVVAIALATYVTGRMYVNYRAVWVFPGGAIIYASLPPARDFVTSGLEVSSILLWIAVLWALTLGWIKRGYHCSTKYLMSLSFWIGLGVLVRPDLVVVSVPIMIFLFFHTSHVYRKVLLVIAAYALPCCYEIFRMGYYGLPVPNTAIAKDASSNKTSQGLVYAWDTIGTYYLWFIAVIVIAIGGSFWLVYHRYAWGKRDDPYKHYRTRRMPTKYEISYPITGDVYASRGIKGMIANLRYRFRFPTMPSLGRTIALLELCGGLQWVYWIHQGGDFMHARVLLPAIFIALLPVMCTPVHMRSIRNVVAQTSWKVLTVVIVLWALGVVTTGSQYPTSIMPENGIVDERQFYAINTAHEHPITVDDYIDYIRMRPLRQAIAEHPAGGVYFVAGDYDHWVYSPFLPGLEPQEGKPRQIVFYLNLGMPSMLTSLDVKVIDQVGLAYPIAAHSDRLPDGRIGHDKHLLEDWVVAQYHVYPLPGMDIMWVRQAVVALQCPATANLIDSYSSQLTWARWKQNIKHAFQYMTYRIDRIPEYSDEMCGLALPQPKRESGK